MELLERHRRGEAVSDEFPQKQALGTKSSQAGR